MSLNQINFLPPAYLKERRRHLRVMRESMLVVLAAGVIIVWYLVAQARVRSLETLVETRVGQAQDQAREKNEMAQLDQQRLMLVQQLQIERELSQPVNLTGVVSTLAQFMPASMALTDLSIQTPVPKPPVQEKQKPRQTGHWMTKAQSKVQGEAKALPPPVMTIWIVGLATNDLEVADFIGRLTQHALFNKVQLAYTRAIHLRDKDVQAREFRVELEIRLDRLYVTPSTHQPQGVAYVH